jgi:phospholipase C
MSASPRTAFFAILLYVLTPFALSSTAALGQQQTVQSGIQKIDHVIFLLKENRTYDNMFGAFDARYGTKTCKLSTGQVVPIGPGPRPLSPRY